MKNRIIAYTIAVVMFCVGYMPAIGQDSLTFFDPAPSYVPERGLFLGASLGGAYILSMTGLYTLWYKDYATTGFHTFNDNSEWLQMDKIGHVGSAYYLGNWGMELFRWTGMKEKKAVWMGGSVGFIFLTTIEIFDAFSEEWGFSTGDMIANTGGALMAISQELAWNEQRVKIKFSFHESNYAKYRPGLLGDSYTESLFKDYNGQTYWLSGNISAFLSEKSGFPRWLNVAVGYGADGMTGARNNSVSETEGSFIADEARRRQYYLSPDIDLTRIPVKSKFLKSVFSVVGFIKIPAPSLEYDSNGNFKFHYLYF